MEAACHIERTSDFKTVRGWVVIFRIAEVGIGVLSAGDEDTTVFEESCRVVVASVIEVRGGRECARRRVVEFSGGKGVVLIETRCAASGNKDFTVAE